MGRKEDQSKNQIPGEAAGPGNISFFSPDNMRNAMRWAKGRSFYHTARHLGEVVIPIYNSPAARVGFLIGTGAVVGVVLIRKHNESQRKLREQEEVKLKIEDNQKH